MEVFKITRKQFSTKLIASGKAQRWNLDDQFTIYTGSSRSLSSLELIVNKNAVKPTVEYKFMIISIADDENLITHILNQNLPQNWRSMTAYPALQRIGSQWYLQKQSLILKVSSAVVPHEYNYIINTHHPDFEKKISLVRTEDYFWDERLF